MGLWRVRHDWVTSLSLFPFMHWRRKWQLIPVFLPGETQGWAAVYGVTQSRTRLKRLSSSSSEIYLDWCSNAPQKVPSNTEKVKIPGREREGQKETEAVPWENSFFLFLKTWGWNSYPVAVAMPESQRCLDNTLSPLPFLLALPFHHPSFSYHLSSLPPFLPSFQTFTKHLWAPMLCAGHLVTVGLSYSRVFMSLDSNNQGLKIFRGKIPESFKKQNLNLLYKGNYLHAFPLR